MLLSVAERIMILNLLPAEGDVISLRIVRDLQSKLSFTEAEHAILKFKEEGSKVTWQPMDPADIEIGHRAWVMIADLLLDLSTKKKLRLEQLDLYERFRSEAED